MLGCRRHLTLPATLAVGLLCVALPAYAQESGLAAFAFTPFSAGLVGGVITGLSAPNTRWNKYGPIIWFACWVLLYTSVFAFFSERPMDAIPLALGISGLWGIIPFALTFSIGRFVTEKLRAYIVSHGKH
jgi:FtsH-binding integral membrane protein